MIYLGVDPGVHKIAWALGNVENLIGCGLYELSDPDKEGKLWQARMIIRHVMTETGKALLEPYTDYYNFLTIIEAPRYRPRAGINHNHVLDLAMVAGACATGEGRIRIVYPQEWKGTIPKAQHHKQLLKRLDKRSLDVLGSNRDHNVLDAIGIWLWAKENTI